MLHRLPDLLPGSGIHKIGSGLIGTKFQITAHGHIEHVRHSRFNVSQDIKIHDLHILYIIDILLRVRIPECNPAVSVSALLPKQPLQPGSTVQNGFADDGAPGS